MIKAITFLLLTVTGLTAQDLTQAKGLWRSGQYEQVLPPLISLHDAYGGFEVDYMLGTSLCRIPRFSADGYDYLQALLRSYTPPLTFDGAPVDLKYAERVYCPNAGVAGIAAPPPIAGGGPGYTARERRIPLNPNQILANVRNKMNEDGARGSPSSTPAPSLPATSPSGTSPSSEAPPNPFYGFYNMVHDGWRGTLVLRQSGSLYTDSNGRRYPVRIRLTGGSEIVFYVLGLGGENADNSGGQKFDGYLMTQTHDAIAGVTWWSGRPFGFYCIRR